jgi:hypothetical protein
MSPVVVLLALTAAASLAVKAQAALEVSSSMRKQVAEGGITGEELFRAIRLNYKGDPTSGLALVSARIEDGRVTAMAMVQPGLEDGRPTAMALVQPPAEMPEREDLKGYAYPERGSWLSAEEAVPADVRIPAPVLVPAHALMRELRSGKDKINTVFKPLDFDIQSGVVYLLAAVPVNEEEMEGFETSPLFGLRKKPGR